MKDPKRWSEIDGGGPSEMAELLRAAGPLSPLTSEHRARLLARAQEIAGQPPAGSGRLMLKIKKLLVSLFGVMGVGLVCGGDGGMLPPRLVFAERFDVEVPAFTFAQEKTETPVLVEKHGEKPITLPRKVQKRQRKAAAEQEDTLLQEALMLEQARQALETKPGETLLWVETHEQYYPHGRLATEREYLAMEALFQVGRVDEARAKGEALLARAAKDDPYKEKVRAVFAARQEKEEVK